MRKGTRVEVLSWGGFPGGLCLRFEGLVEESEEEEMALVGFLCPGSLTSGVLLCDNMMYEQSSPSRGSGIFNISLSYYYTRPTTTRLQTRKFASSRQSPAHCVLSQP